MYTFGLFLITGSLALGAQICQRQRGGELIRLPGKLNCTDPNKYSQWTIKLEKLNVAEYESDAQGLLVIERTCETFTNFWSTKLIKDKTIKKLHLPQDIAMTLMKQRSCITAENTITMNNGDSKYSCEYGYLQNKITKTVTCHHYQGGLISRHDGTVRTDITSFENCIYSKQYCYTVDGTHLIWDVVDKVKQQYVEVGIFNATVLNNNILVNSLSMNFLLQNNSAAVGLTITDREYRVTLIEQFSPPKVKLMSVPDDIQILQNEIDSKFSYLLHMISSPKAQLTYLCNVFNMLIDLEHISAANDATSYIRRKTNNQYLTAEKAGDFLVVWPCLEVESWSWHNAEANKSCYAGLPIKYNLAGSENTYMGYLQPKDNTILTSGIEVPCHEISNIYTSVNGIVELHTGHSANITKIDTSNAIPMEIQTGGSIPFVDFISTNWAFENRELSHNEMQRQILDQISDDIFDLKADTAAVTEIHYIWKLLHIAEGSVYAMIAALFTWVERVLVIILTYKCLIKPRLMRLMRYRRSRRYTDCLEMNDLGSQ